MEDGRVLVLDHLLHFEDRGTVVGQGGDVSAVADEVELGVEVAGFDEKGGDEDDDDPVRATTEEDACQ